jgi:hypothetical protein
MTTTFYIRLIILSVLLVALSFGNAFTSKRRSATTRGCNSRSFSYSSSSTMTSVSSWPYQYSTMVGSTVIDSPTKEKADKKTRRGAGGNDGSQQRELQENFEDALRKQGPLEWLEELELSRDLEDPFHILLLGQTFEKPKITVPYVASSLECKLVSFSFIISCRLVR